MPHVIILISANYEWQVVRAHFRTADIQLSPYGEWFSVDVRGLENPQTDFFLSSDKQPAQFIFFQSGWGKIAAASSTQYVIDRWAPELLINLGTCGGFEGEIQRGEIILVDKTIVYDIFEQMGDSDEHLAHYTTWIDLSWLGKPWPLPVRQTLLVSADRDLIAKEISELKQKYNAVAGDWESGAIAWVANRNQTHLLILRGVTDLVGINGGEAYGNIEYFAKSAQKIMKKLIDSLPDWLKLAGIQ